MLYVVILSAAQDLVGTLPKGIVLLADVMPSFFVKLIAPYFIHRVPYGARVVVFAATSTCGMLLVALAPGGAGSHVGAKMAGVVLASLSSGGGELSFLGLMHYYGRVGLAGWGSGTGAAGLVGAGLYVLLTSWWGFTVRQSLLVAACLPVVMLVSFFVILPRGPLREGARRKEYEPLRVEDGEDLDVTAVPEGPASSALLAPGPSVAATAFSADQTRAPATLRDNLQRSRALVIPYMLPLVLVYVAEYTINQGVAPTLLFPLEGSPFSEFRDFYPFYGFLYQLGVFISRSSTPFLRIHYLYLPSLLQMGNVGILTLQALFFFLPSVYLVFVVIFWEGLLGGAVYVNCFAEIMEKVAPADREFSLGAVTVSDSAGICLAGFLGMLMETRLCDYQVARGRDWCRRIEAQRR